MEERPKPVSQPFQFRTSLILHEATGLRAATLPQLAALLRKVPEGCVYHHTHDFLLSHHYLTPEPAHDFAYWVTEVLGETALGERLASIDLLDYHSLGDLREALAGTMEAYLEQAPSARMRFAAEGQEFFFVKAVHVVMPTAHTATTLEEFYAALGAISIHALYYHMFDARLRVGHRSNDFARWLGEQLGLRELADDVARLDPYVHTLENLRARLRILVERALGPRTVPHG